MELRQLNYFLTICETKNFTRAAERLYISQPALTNQINTLESELGMKLLKRTNKNVELTQAGEIFRTHALQVVSEVNSTLFHIKEIKGIMQERVRFGLHPFLSRLYFRDVAEIIREQLEGHEILFSVSEDHNKEDRFTFKIFPGTHGKQEKSAVELAWSPIVRVAGNGHIMVIPGAAGTLTEDILHALPEHGLICEANNVDNPMEFLLSEDYTMLLPEAMLDFNLPSAIYEPQIYAAIFLYCEDVQLCKTLEETLGKYFGDRGWKPV